MSCPAGHSGRPRPGLRAHVRIGSVPQHRPSPILHISALPVCGPARRAFPASGWPGAGAGIPPPGVAFHDPVRGPGSSHGSFHRQSPSGCPLPRWLLLPCSTAENSRQPGGKRIQAHSRSEFQHRVSTSALASSPQGPLFCRSRRFLQLFS